MFHDWGPDKWAADILQTVFRLLRRRYGRTGVTENQGTQQNRLCPSWASNGCTPWVLLVPSRDLARLLRKPKGVGAWSHPSVAVGVLLPELEMEGRVFTLHLNFLPTVMSCIKGANGEQLASRSGRCTVQGIHALPWSEVQNGSLEPGRAGE